MVGEFIKVPFDGTQDYVDVSYVGTYPYNNVQVGVLTSSSSTVRIDLVNRTSSSVRVRPDDRFVGTVVLIVAAIAAPDTSGAFDLVMTGPTLPAGLIASARSGGELLLARSAVTAIRQAAASTGVYEDRGDGVFVGLWTFPAYSNSLAAPEDLSNGAWSNLNGAIVTLAASTSPDGTTTAMRIADTNGVSFVAIYQAFAAAQSMNTHSLWVKDGPVTPTVGGGIWTDPGAAYGKSFGSGAAWRRIGAYAVDTSVDHALTPAGYSPGAGEGNASPVFTGAAVGSVDTWGHCYVASTAHDYPGVITTTGAQDYSISSTILPRLLPSGDLDLAGRFVATALGYGYGQQDAGYIFAAMTPDGLIAFRYAVNGNWTLTVRGVDIASLNQLGAVNGTIVDWRVRYKPSEGKYRIAVRFNGCGTPEASGSTTGGALQAATAMTLGSNFGANYFPAVHQRLRTMSGGSVRTPAEFLLIGDSIVAPWTNYGTANEPCVGNFIYTAPEVDSRLGITSVAIPGNTIEQQQAAFLASEYATDTLIKGVGIMCGINNIYLSGDSAATVKTKLEALIATVKGSIPGVKVALLQMIPAGGTLTGPQKAVWTTVNGYINAGTIVGADTNVTAHEVALDDGSGNLVVNYNVDGVHPTGLGRKIIGSTGFRAGFHALGLI